MIEILQMDPKHVTKGLANDQELIWQIGSEFAPGSLISIIYWHSLWRLKFNSTCSSRSMERHVHQEYRPWWGHIAFSFEAFLFSIALLANVSCSNFPLVFALFEPLFASLSSVKGCCDALSPVAASLFSKVAPILQVASSKPTTSFQVGSFQVGTSSDLSAPSVSWDDVCSYLARPSVVAPNALGDPRHSFLAASADDVCSCPPKPLADAPNAPNQQTDSCLSSAWAGAFSCLAWPCKSAPSFAAVCPRTWL